MEHYREHVEQVIKPYLKKYRKEFWLEREAGKRLFCVKYRLKHPKGVIVFSHGFSENEEKYQEEIHRCLKEGYSVYFMEHCGHGRSYRLVDDPCMVYVDRYERYIEDFICFSKLVEKENRKLPRYLYGHSMGGGIAAVVVSKEPELYQKVVLTSPMIRLYVPGIPYREMVAVARANCRAGKAAHYIVGHGPYKGPKPLEQSSSMRRARHEYYQSIREENPCFQTNGSSYGWINEADRLNQYLRKEGWKHIKIPVLLFQARHDHLVSAKAQVNFIYKLHKAGNKNTKYVRVPNSKHEIYNSDKKTREAYWRMIFRFIGGDNCGV